MNDQIKRCNKDGGSFSAISNKTEPAMINALEIIARIDDKMIFSFRIVLL